MKICSFFNNFKRMYTLFYAIENGLNLFVLCHHLDIEFLSLTSVNARSLPVGTVPTLFPLQIVIPPANDIKTVAKC